MMAISNAENRMMNKRSDDAALSSDSSLLAHEEQSTIKSVTCPYCGSKDTEFFSLFGQQLLTAQYYCNGCHTPFEHIKDDEVLDIAL